MFQVPFYSRLFLFLLYGGLWEKCFSCPKGALTAVPQEATGKILAVWYPVLWYSPETWWRARTRAETGVRSPRRPRRCPWCRSASGRTDRQTVRPSSNHVADSFPASKSQRYLVVVGAEVLEVAEADVGQTHHDGDDQHHQSEQRGRRLKPCRHSGRGLASLGLALLALAS